MARLYDTAGDETFYGRATYSFMQGDGFLNNVEGYGEVHAYASTGNDVALLYDGSGDDLFYAVPESAQFANSQKS